MSKWSERAAYLKSVQRCVRCKKQDAYTMNGHPLCYECTEKNRENARRYHQENREKRLQILHERYERLKSQGLCVECGKKARSGFVMCHRCAMKSNESTKRWLAERSEENG